MELLYVELLQYRKVNWHVFDNWSILDDIVLSDDNGPVGRLDDSEWMHYRSCTNTNAALEMRLATDDRRRVDLYAESRFRRFECWVIK